jgi:hypothetical protein
MAQLDQQEQMAQLVPQDLLDQQGQQEHKEHQVLVLAL